MAITIGSKATEQDRQNQILVQKETKDSRVTISTDSQNPHQQVKEGNNIENIQSRPQVLQRPGQTQNGNIQRGTEVIQRQEQPIKTQVQNNTVRDIQVGSENKSQQQLKSNQENTKPQVLASSGVSGVVVGTLGIKKLLANGSPFVPVNWVKPGQYAPGGDGSATDNVIMNGDDLQLTVPYSIQGQAKKVWLTVGGKVVYINGNTDNAMDTKWNPVSAPSDTYALTIKSDSQTIAKPNATGSIIANVRVQGGWKQAYIPDVTLNVEGADGKVTTKKIDVPTYYINRAYNLRQGVYMQAGAYDQATNSIQASFNFGNNVLGSTPQSDVNTFLEGHTVTNDPYDPFYQMQKITAVHFRIHLGEGYKLTTTLSGVTIKPDKIAGDYDVTITGASNLQHFVQQQTSDKIVAFTHDLNGFTITGPAGGSFAPHIKIDQTGVDYSSNLNNLIGNDKDVYSFTQPVHLHGIGYNITQWINSEGTYSEGTPIPGIKQNEYGYSKNFIIDSKTDFKSLPADCSGYSILATNGVFSFTNKLAQGIYPPNAMFYSFSNYSKKNGTIRITASDWNNGFGKGYSLSQIKTMLASGESLPQLNVMVTGFSAKAGDTSFTNKAFAFGTDVTRYTVVTSTDASMVKKLQTDKNQYDQNIANGVFMGNTNNTAYLNSIQYGAKSKGIMTFSPWNGKAVSKIVVKTGSTGKTITSVDNSSGKVSDKDLLDGSGFYFSFLGNVNLPGDNSLTDLLQDPYLKAGTKLYVDMGAPFSLQGPVTVAGVVCPTSVSGNELTITIPRNINAHGMGEDNPSNVAKGGWPINFKAAYNVAAIKPIQLIYSGFGTQDIGVKINNTDYELDKLIPWFTNEVMGSSTTHLTLVPAGKDTVGCVHRGFSTGGDNYKYTDVVANTTKSDGNYLIVGGVPYKNYNIAVNEGKSESEVNSGYINAINSNGDVYVITSDKATAKDISLINSANASTLASNAGYIKSHWTKYTKGMKGIIGYAIFTPIKAGQAFTGTYDVTSNINSLKNAYSGFKFANLTNNTSSISNIVTVTAPKAAPVVKGSAKVEVYDLNGDSNPLDWKNLTGGRQLTNSGADYSSTGNVGTAIGKTTFTVDAKAKSQGLSNNLESIQGVVIDGVKYKSISTEGQGIIKALLNNTYTLKYGSTPTTIKWYIGNTQAEIQPTHDVKVMMYNETTKKLQVPNTLITSGKEGTEITGADLDKDVPAGYHVVSMKEYTYSKSNPGVQIEKLHDITKLPTEIGDHSIQLIYYIVKNAPTPKPVVKTGSVTVTVQTTDGKILVPTKTVDEGNVGTEITGTSYPTQKGYHLVKTTVNGSEDNIDGNPATSVTGTIKDGVTKIVYTVAKDAPNTGSSTVTVINDTTGKVVSSYNTNGDTGSAITKTSGVIPKGYHLVKTTVNGTTETPKEVTGLQDNKSGLTYETGKTTKIVYHIVKDTPKAGKVIVSIVDDTTGKVLNTYNNSGMNGANITKTSEVIPKGYHLVKTTVNGTTETAKEVTGLQDNKSGLTYESGKTTTIVYHVVKDNSISITVYGPNGKVELPTTTTDGIPGETWNDPWHLPKGEKITKITVDGKVVSNINDLPKNYDKSHKIVITTEAPHTIGITVVGTDGKVFMPLTTTSGYEGDTYKPDYKVPNGYHISKVLVNGKEVSINDLPKVYGNKNDKITIIVAPNSSGITITVNNETDGNVILPPTTTQGTVGSTYTPAKWVMPKGGKIVKVTVNGVEVPYKDIPKTYDGKKQDIRITIETPFTNSITVESQDGKVLIPTVTVEGYTGDHKDLSASTPKGYHIVKITLNGKEIPASEIPQVIGKQNNKVIIIVAKDVKNTIKVVGPDGKVISHYETPEGAPGTKAPLPLKVPEHYHITSITDNGKEIPQSEIPEVIGKKGQNIIVHIAKDVKNTIKVVGPDGKVFNHHETPEGIPGTKAPLPCIVPKHYHITSITDNGKEIPKSEIPQVIGKKGQNVIVHVAPDAQNTVKVITANGKLLNSNETPFAVPGTKEPLTYSVPKGYKITGVLINGVPASIKDIPTVIGEKDKHVVIIVTKIPTPEKPHTVIINHDIDVPVTKTVTHTVVVNHTAPAPVQPAPAPVQPAPQPMPQPQPAPAPMPQAPVQPAPVETVVMQHTGLPVESVAHVNNITEVVADEENRKRRK